MAILLLSLKVGLIYDPLYLLSYFGVAYLGLKSHDDLLVGGRR